MNPKKQYTQDDLIMHTLPKITNENGVVSHTHTVEFGRPLTEAECHLFRSILTGFYHTVRFSHQFGGNFVAEPSVEFITPKKAQYTLHQTSMTGAWKELLFAILGNFSLEVAPILRHDESSAFAPERVVSVPA